MSPPVFPFQDWATTVAARSPLTGAFGEAEAGGYSGAGLKFSGFDSAVAEGRAKQTSLPLDSQWWHREIRDASGFWGLDNKETRSESGKN